MSVPTTWLEDAQGRRWPVGMTAALGRSGSNDVVIDDGKVSRRHALVHKQDEAEFWLIDLGSGNGTYLNGRRVTQPTRLADGDTLTLGEQSFSFRQMTGRALDPGHSGLSAQTIINIRSRDCWLLVADIKNSTAMAARLSSTDLAIAVGRWMGTCKEFIDARGGAINKFLGDGFFAYWVAGNTPPETIVDAVAALRTLQRDAGGPRFRIVLHYGQVAFGGGGSLGEDSLSGVDVVVAFRMERLAGTLGTDVLVSEEVRRRLSEWMSFHDAGEHPVPGLDGVSRRFYSAS